MKKRKKVLLSKSYACAIVDENELHKVKYFYLNLHTRVSNWKERNKGLQCVGNKKTVCV